MVQTPPMSCTSRFRVIKLDHGTGEPYRRGRWTCTDFYDRDSDSNRTVDRLKPALNLNHNVERDSGLGSTSFSVITSTASPMQVVDNTPDSGHFAAVEHLSESLHKGYSMLPQNGSRVSAFQPTGYTHKPTHVQVYMQPGAPQASFSDRLNDVHQSAMQQKIPVDAPVTLSQQLGHSTHPEGLNHGHTDYHQHNLGSKTHPPTTSLVMGSSSVSTSSAAVGKQGQHREDKALALLPQVGNAPAEASIPPISIQQQDVSETQPSGGLGDAPLSSITDANGLFVPATENNTTCRPPSVPSTIFDIGGLVQSRVALGGVTAGFSKPIDGWKKFDALPQNCGDVMAVKDDVKRFFSDDLGLSTPATNSLVGIHLTMNADEDSGSSASVVAIDNKIEQAMDLVKSHLMYAVREEVEVLKEQIKELYERNSLLERENAVLKSLANSEQLNQLSSQRSPGRTSPQPLQHFQHELVTNANALLAHQGDSQSIPH